MDSDIEDGEVSEPPPLEEPSGILIEPILSSKQAHNPCESPSDFVAQPRMQSDAASPLSRDVIKELESRFDSRFARMEQILEKVAQATFKTAQF